MFFIATVLGIVEGLTEFVPVSSTGHLILAGHLLGFTGPKAETFEIFIQLGAILAVLGAFPHRFRALFSTASGTPGFSGKRGWWLLAITSAPALFLGKLAHNAIKERLFNPLTVALGLFVGGILMLVAERFRPKPGVLSVDQIDWKRALGVGCFQCLALWPGMSRSSSTIVGGMLLGLSRDTAAEFSFLAATPIIAAATVYDLYKSWHLLSTGDLGMFAWGFLVSGIFAWFSIRFLLRYLSTHSLAVLGVYRLGVAIAVFVLMR